MAPVTAAKLPAVTTPHALAPLTSGSRTGTESQPTSAAIVQTTPSAGARTAETTALVTTPPMTATSQSVALHPSAVDRAGVSTHQALPFTGADARLLMLIGLAMLLLGAGLRTKSGPSRSSRD
jgi:hypothetical protein